MATDIVRLNKEQLERMDRAETNYIGASNASSGSQVDANGNVTHKNVATLNAEFFKPSSVQYKRYQMSKLIASMYGQDVADEYNRQIQDHEIYVHDESHPFFPYCASITMYPLLTEGLKGFGSDSIPPKHLLSFCGNFINLVYATASQFSGAVATVEFLMYFDYYAKKDFGNNYLEKDPKTIKQFLQEVVYQINQPTAARGFQSVFWNISLFDEHYFEHLFGNFVFPDGTKPNYKSLSELQEFFMTWFNKERTRAILTFPVVTAAALVQDGEPVDVPFMEMCAKQQSQGNSFFVYMSDSVDSLASCCRLRNELQDNAFSYSLGAGGVSTGSLNVITINANRLIQDATKKGVEINAYLKEQIEKVHKYQMATKAYLKKYLDSGMLDAYKAGFINMDKQFLTIGINGLVEGAEFLGLEIGNNESYRNFTESFLKTIYDTNKEGKKTYKTMFNTEFVPAENLGVKNYNWDKKDGYVVPSNRVCYNSYLYRVEDENIDIVDKFILHGKENLQYLDGGSALHLNLAEYPTMKGYIRLWKLAAKTGCNYWTTNVCVTVCKEPACRYIDKRTLDYCSKCGSKNVNWATRIIGYMREVTAWSEDRQKEFGLRFHHKMAASKKQPE